jgi:hypothetical protein
VWLSPFGTNTNLIMATSSTSGQSSGPSDYLTYAQLVAQLGEPAARRLARYADHVGLDGSCCFEADHAADLLGMLTNDPPRGHGL